MRYLKCAVTVLLAGMLCSAAFAQPVKVFVNVRGNTGIEGRVRNVISREFASFDLVEMASSREECQLYLDLAVVEQEPIRFYALGVSVAYHIRDQFYSRPTSDVAQFGEERMEEVCCYLAKEIDKAFLEPLRSRE